MSSMTINAGTIAGPHHKNLGEENQDALYSLQENGYTIIACADGAGSLENSGVGASMAAATAVEEAMDSLITGNGIDEALHRGVEMARDAIMAREDYAIMGCTLSLAVNTPNGWGVALVGDAFAVVSQSVDDHLLIHREPDSEYANITKLITSNDYDPMYVYGEGPVAAISVSSDGLTNLSVNIGERQASENFWTPIVQRALNGNMDVQSFLEYMEQKEKLYDDTTLVIASNSQVS